MGNIRDKSERAVRAFILDAVKGVNANTPIYTANNSKTRAFGDGAGLVDVDATQLQESPPGSGVYAGPVMVRAKYPAAEQPDDPDGEFRRVELGKLTAALHDVLHQTDNHQDYHATAKLISDAGNALVTDPTSGADPFAVQQAADNADMGAFSCLNVMHQDLVGGKPESDSLAFVELINFQVIVSGVGGYWN